MKNDIEDFDAIGNDHIGTSSDTPIRKDAFKLTTDEKIDIIKDDVRHIMETLGLDLTGDTLKGTPNRVAKMFVKGGKSIQAFNDEVGPFSLCCKFNDFVKNGLGLTDPVIEEIR